MRTNSITANFGTVGIFLAIWIVLAIGIWLFWVPSLLSPMGFAWLNVGVIGFALVLSWIVHDSAPTRSVEEILYDVEHDPTKPSE